MILTENSSIHTESNPIGRAMIPCAKASIAIDKAELRCIF